MQKQRKKTNGQVEKKRTRKKCACRKREKGKHAHGKKERKPCMAVEKEKKRYTEQSRDRMLRNKHRTDYTRENILKKQIQELYPKSTADPWA